MNRNNILKGQRYSKIEKSIEKLSTVSDVAKSFIGKTLCVYPVVGMLLKMTTIAKILIFTLMVNAVVLK